MAETIAQRNKRLKQRKKGFNSHTIDGNTVYITLNNDTICLCDKQDLPLISKFRWCFHNGYARANVKIPDIHKTKSYWMHQVIMGRPYIDHINGNGLDNRRQNLRPYDHNSLNLSNSCKRANNTTGYIGVKLHRNRYEAYIDFKGKRYFCGSFLTPEEAARARDKKAKELAGDFAKLNFPEEV